MGIGANKSVIVKGIKIMCLLVIASALVGCGTTTGTPQEENTYTTEPNAQEIIYSQAEFPQEPPNISALFTSTISIHDYMPAFTFVRIIGGEPIKRYDYNFPTYNVTIRIYDADDHLVQEITGLYQTTSPFNSLDDDWMQLSFIDLNFNGYLDMRLFSYLHSERYPGWGQHYHWLWDTELGQFVFNQQLTDFLTSVSIQVDEETKTWSYGWSQDAGNTQIVHHFGYAHGHFVEVRREESNFIRIHESHDIYDGLFIHVDSWSLVDSLASDDPRIKHISIFNWSGELIQEMRDIHTSSPVIAGFVPPLPPAAVYGFTTVGLHFADYNNDGYLDMALAISAGGSSQAAPRRYWLWCPAKAQFISNTALERLSGEASVWVDTNSWLGDIGHIHAYSRITTGHYGWNTYTLIDGELALMQRHISRLLFDYPWAVGFDVFETTNYTNNMKSVLMMPFVLVDSLVQPTAISIQLDMSTPWVQEIDITVLHENGDVLQEINVSFDEAILWRVDNDFYMADFNGNGHLDMAIRNGLYYRWLWDEASQQFVFIGREGYDEDEPDACILEELHILWDDGNTQYGWRFDGINCVLYAITNNGEINQIAIFGSKFLEAGSPFSIIDFGIIDDWIIVSMGDFQGSGAFFHGHVVRLRNDGSGEYFHLTEDHRFHIIDGWVYYSCLRTWHGNSQGIHRIRPDGSYNEYMGHILHNIIFYAGDGYVYATQATGEVLHAESEWNPIINLVRWHPGSGEVTTLFTGDSLPKFEYPSHIHFRNVVVTDEYVKFTAHVEGYRSVGWRNSVLYRANFRVDKDGSNLVLLNEDFL